MAPTQDYGVEFEGALFQPSTGYVPDGPTQGVGSYSLDGAKMDRADDHGEVDGYRRLPASLITSNWLIPADDSVCGTARARIAYTEPLARALRAAFGPQDAHVGTERAIDLLWPGAPTSNEVVRWYGQPQFVETRQSAQFGHQVGISAFKRSDPIAYGPEEVAVDSSSPASVTNSGDVAVDRFTVAVTGNGGIPVITSTTDDNSAVAFASALAGAAVATMNFRAHTVSIGGVLSYPLSPGPLWFKLRPGANTITFTGCASIEVTYRAGYLL